MAIHQHQALSVINMLFMNRMRVVKRVEMLRLQHNEELGELGRAKQAEINSTLGPIGAKGLSKKQQKQKQTIEQKYVSL